MRHEFFIAKRYFLSKRRIGFITFISLISITGLTIGTAALLIVLSVFNGFGGLVTSLLVGFDPHIRIEREGNQSIVNYDSITGMLDKNSKVKAYTPFISDKAMILYGTLNKAIYVKGIDDEKIGSVSGVKDKMVSGKFKFDDNPKAKSIVIGLTLSDRLGASTGDTLSLISSAGLEYGLTQFSSPRIYKFVIAGVFESNNKEYDSYYSFISIPAARDLFDIKQGYKGIEIKLKDINNSEEVKNSLVEKLDKSFMINSWYDLHKDLYSMMQIERWIAYIILCLIIAVASFNMLGSLTMTVIEKKRDIGILRSMGSTRKSIIRIFMFEGMIIGVVGTVLGCIIGLIVCILQQEFGLFPLDPNVYIIPAIPVEIRYMDFIAVSFASILLSFLATLYPAKRAANLIPIEAIRWE
jgi:lipoprotein-releasing system permease protein